MRVETMVMVMLVVSSALVTAKPFYQSRRPQCKVGTSWPDEDGCNTCTCRDDATSFACTRRSCDLLQQQQVDLGIIKSDEKVDPLQERIALHNNNQDELQALQDLAVSSTDHGQWIPFDINGHVFTAWS